MLSSLEIVAWLKDQGIVAMPKMLGGSKIKAFKYVFKNGQVLYVKRKQIGERDVPVERLPMVISWNSSLYEKVYLTDGVFYDSKKLHADSAAFEGFPKIESSPRGRDFGVSSVATLENVVGIISGGRVSTNSDSNHKIDFDLGSSRSSRDNNSNEDEWIFQEIRTRRGQNDFRRKLFEKYGGRCAVSGSKVFSVLEAAHIVPHREGTNYSVDNGILMRADLHTLFDLHLLSVSASGVISVDPVLLGTEYEIYGGNVIFGNITAEMRENLTSRKLMRDCVSTT